MTRATLLHVLDRPTALGPDEVRELEQLAKAFPYCQTAHLLLAKAAHDQGTMLAGQRLRRAATYAADRTLLRRLIEQMEPATTTPPLTGEVSADLKTNGPAETTAAAVETPEAEPQPEVILPTNVVLPVFQPAAEPAQVQLATIVAAAPLATPAPEAVLPALILELHEQANETPKTPAEASVTQAAAIVPVSVLPAETTAAEAPHAPTQPTVPVEVQIASETVTPILSVTKGETAPEPTPETELPLIAPVLPDLERLQISVSEPVGKSFSDTPPESITEQDAAIIEPDLPAQAPAIRPPAEVGEARFEYGLAVAPAPLGSVYEFPGLVDEFAASAVTLSMGSPELPAVLLGEAAAVSAPFTPAAFTGDATVGYSFGESSRLGLCMQLINLLTAKAEAAESNTAVVAAAQPPAVSLPPTGTFFEPDPLLLDHWATHCPPPLSRPSSFDIINNFLRRQPRLSRPAMLPPTPASQADLSVRSTHAEPDLVSENLARIFVRQGKIVRAIEIYEKLMVKQPEKMAYFAAQIQSLQPSA